MDILGIYFLFIFHFTTSINDVTLTADSICIYMLKVRSLYLLVASQQNVLPQFIVKRKSIWPFMFLDTFDLSDQKMLSFSFLWQAKFICCASTVLLVLSSTGLKWTTITVHASVVIIVSFVTNLWCKDLKPTINKAREGSGFIAKTHLCNWAWWRGGVITDVLCLSA